MALLYEAGPAPASGGGVLCVLAPDSLVAHLFDLPSR